MSEPRPPLPVKPIASLIMARRDIGEPVMRHLADFFGPPDLLGPWRPFTATKYYDREMGPDLVRRCTSFLHLADPACLARWKVLTNGVEKEFSLGGRRLVNIDIGYVAKERLVLATGKNYTHRLYLKHGIFGEVTLVYSQGEFQALPWSYPDYAEKEMSALLGLIRRKYLWQLQILA
ncbi:MAG: DUF4416 family protein [Deltaproteobacteria bacterium]|nr:DUF4416 family protein [Deltaproteobacteria bacterium]